MARQTTFYNAKAVEVSTPTIKGHSAIAKSYVKGTMERWVSQCPHCKGFHELRWEDIRYEYDTIETHGEKTYKGQGRVVSLPGVRLHFGRSDHEAGTSSLASGKSRRL